MYLSKLEEKVVLNTAYKIIMEELSSMDREDVENIYDRMARSVNDIPGKKYEIVQDDTKEIQGHILYRIRSLKDFVFAKKGELGGYIESEENLSQEGACWIKDGAIVCGKAVIKDNARVGDEAKIFQGAEVGGNSMVFGNAMVFGKAKVYGSAWVKDNAKVSDNAEIYDRGMIEDNAIVRGNAKVYEKGVVRGDATIEDNAEIFNDAEVFGNARIGGETKIHGIAKVDKNVEGDIDEDSFIKRK